MCRAVPPAKFQINCDAKLKLKIKQAEPEAYAEKLAELRENNALQADWAGVELVYGNRYQTVAPKSPKSNKGLAAFNTNKWTAFVKFANKKIAPTNMIEKVRFGLHPSFGVDYMDKKAPEENGCYEVTFTGFGTFEVPITITFKR